MEVLFEEKICEKALKIILYENFKFKLMGSNSGTGFIEFDSMKEIINTWNIALKYLKTHNFGIEQLGHYEGNMNKENYFIYNQDGIPYRIGFYCCNKKIILEFNIGNSRKIEFFRFYAERNGTDNIHISQKCFSNLNQSFIEIFKKIAELKKREPERKEELKNNVKKGLEKLSKMFKELTFEEIALKIGHNSPQKVEEIHKSIEEILSEGLLNARIKKDTLVFDKPLEVRAVNILTNIKDDTIKIKEKSDHLEILNEIKDDTVKIELLNTSQLSVLKDIKNNTELIKEYTSKIEDLLDKTDDIEKFLQDHLSSDYEKIKDSVREYKLKKINKTELAWRIFKIFGKNVLKLLLKKI